MAFFSLEPNKLTVQPGKSFTVNLNIDTQGQKTILAEALISYNSNILEIAEVKKGTFYPSLSHNVGPNRLYIGGYVSDRLSDSRTGYGILASIVFLGKAKGASQVKFQCSPASVSESNIIAKDTSSSDIINCDKNISGLYTVETEKDILTPAQLETPSDIPNLFLTIVLLTTAFIIMLVIFLKKR